MTQPASPFLDPNSPYYQGNTYGVTNGTGQTQTVNGRPLAQGATAQVQGQEGQLPPSYGPGMWVVDQSHGLQRAQAVADYSKYLMGRQGPQMGAVSQGDIDAARAQQQQALGLMRNMASGQTPSVSSAQTYGGLGQNIAAMNAGAQRGNMASAMGRGFGAGQQVANAGAMARQGEQSGLMSAYGQGATGLNANDVAQYGTDINQQLRAQGMANQQGILNAQTTFGVQQQEEQNEMANAAWQQAGQQLAYGASNQRAQQNLQNLETTGKALTSSGGYSDRRLKTGLMHTIYQGQR